MHAKQFGTSNQEYTNAPSDSVVQQMMLSFA